MSTALWAGGGWPEVCRRSPRNQRHGPMRGPERSARLLLALTREGVSMVVTLSDPPASRAVVSTSPIERPTVRGRTIGTELESAEVAGLPERWLVGQGESE